MIPCRHEVEKVVCEPPEEEEEEEEESAFIPKAVNEKDFEEGRRFALVPRLEGQNQGMHQDKTKECTRMSETWMYETSIPSTSQGLHHETAMPSPSQGQGQQQSDTGEPEQHGHSPPEAGLQRRQEHTSSESSTRPLVASALQPCESATVSTKERARQAVLMDATMLTAVVQLCAILAVLAVTAGILLSFRLRSRVPLVV